MIKPFLGKIGVACFSFLSLAFVISCTEPGNNAKTQNDSTSAISNTVNENADQDSNTTVAPPAIPPKDSARAPLDSTKKYVFLTFDDGPQPGTENVMQAIKETGIKATFFMIGLHATFSPLMRSYVDEIRNGYPMYWLANHSYTHAYNDHYIQFYHDPKGALHDFTRTDTSLQVPQRIYRFPGNNAWVLDSGRMRGTKLVRPVMNLMDSMGGRVIGWDVEWHFKRNPHGSGSVPIQNAHLMARQLINTLENHETYRKNSVVLLAHDRMFHLPNYKDSLVTMINIVKQEHPEYVFETIEKL